MTNFSDRLLVVTYPEDGDTLEVFDPNSGGTTPLSISNIEGFIAQINDPTMAYAYNFAAMLNLSGFTVLKNPDGTINADALTLLNSVSFKGYP